MASSSARPLIRSNPTSSSQLSAESTNPFPVSSLQKLPSQALQLHQRQHQTNKNNQKPKNKNTHFLFAICAAVACLGFSSIFAEPVSQLPYLSSPPWPSAPLLLMLVPQPTSECSGLCARSPRKWQSFARVVGVGWWVWFSLGRIYRQELNALCPNDGLAGGDALVMMDGWVGG